MRVAGGEAEDGIVIGNTYDKYASSNPLVRLMMRGFERSLSRLVSKAAPGTIHEVGCGEGHWVNRWLEEGYEARGTDFSHKVIGMAQAEASRRDIDPARFEVRSIYEVTAERDSADLIVCCEVMEHLDDPEAALDRLRRIVKSDLIISVPREPLWRALNVARGKYLSDLGNTPGHLQHWSKRQIVALVSRYFDVDEVVSPFPWTMLHCRTKSRRVSVADNADPQS